MSRNRRTRVSYFLHSPHFFFMALAAVFVAFVGYFLCRQLEFSLFWAYFVGISLVTFGAYAYDKYASIRSMGRVPENVLHLLALVGGSPGALCAQRAFRHKTIKPEFQTAFRLILAVQLVLIVVWAWYRFVHVAHA